MTLLDGVGHAKFGPYLLPALYPVWYRKASQDVVFKPYT